MNWRLNRKDYGKRLLSNTPLGLCQLLKPVYSFLLLPNFLSSPTFIFSFFPHLSEICFWTALGRWLNQTLKTFQAENCKKTWCCWCPALADRVIIWWSEWKDCDGARPSPSPRPSLAPHSPWFFFSTVLKFLEFQTSDRTCVWCPTSQKGLE